MTEKEMREKFGSADRTELRVFAPDIDVEERAEGDGIGVARGVGLPYNSWSDGLPFREKFSPGAFQESIARGDEVYSFINHNRDNILGRTGNKRLKVIDESEALRYEVKIPNTSYGADFVENVRTRNIHGTSIGFIALEDVWGEDEQGYWRNVTKARLTQISPEVTPAYSNTDVAMRSLEAFKEESRTKISEGESDDGEEKNWGFVDIAEKRLELAKKKAG